MKITKILHVGYIDPAGVMEKWSNICNKLSKQYEMRYVIQKTDYNNPNSMDLLPNSEELREYVKECDIFIFHPVIQEAHETEELINDGVNSNICGINWKTVTLGKVKIAILNGSINLRKFNKEYNQLFLNQYEKIFCTTPDLLKLFNFSEYLPVPLDVTSLKYSPNKMIKRYLGIAVSHFPTNPDIKNTQELEKVSQEIAMEFQGYQSLTRTGIHNFKVMDLKKRTHLCFDHMQGYMGVNSLEAAAVGCVPLVYIPKEDRELLANYVGSEDLPFDIVKDAIELKNTIKYYLNNKPEWTLRSKECIDWMKKYWDPQLHLNKFIKALTMKEETKIPFGKVYRNVHRSKRAYKKVSIIIPTYEREKLVVKAIESVLNQTYQDVEVIVVDDGSTDNTKKVVAEIIKKHKNVSYYYKENGGCASALNEGLKRATGDIIGWLSSDDWYDFEANQFIEFAVKIHNENPGVGMTYADYTVCEPKRQYVFEAFEHESRQACINYLLKNCYVNGSSIMLKREVFYTIGGFNEAFKYAQDYELYFRVLSKFDIKKVHYNKKPFLNYYYDPRHECLGKKITAGTENNESNVVLERFNFMFEGGRPTCCAMLCVKNEEDIIDQCINDLSMYVDKIVLLDDGSTDNTIELAKRWRKVEYIYRQEPKVDRRTEGVDRQRLLDMTYQAGTDWGLFIDADEVFSDRYKTQIFQEMKVKDVNLWFYKEINFWRSETYHRIDELYDKGWFGRLFRMMPNLSFNTQGEHCGGVPNNIPNTPLWFSSSKTQKKSNIPVKHYGFSTEKRILDKYIGLWRRERARLPYAKMCEMYHRLIKEDTLAVKRFYERPYWLIGEDPTIPEILGKDHFGISKAMAIELKKSLAEKGIYKNHDKKKKLNNLKIVHVNPNGDPAGVSWLLHKELQKEGYNSRHITLYAVHKTQQGSDLHAPNGMINPDIAQTLKDADILHINGYFRNQIEKHSGEMELELNNFLHKPFILHNHGGATLLNVKPQLDEAASFNPNFKHVSCSPLTKHIIPETTWLPNMVPIHEELYKPVEREFVNCDVLICHKIHNEHVKHYKGTDVLEEVINDWLRTRWKFPLKFHAIFGISVSEALQNSAKHHICIDNLTQGFIGMSGWESMSKGQVVLARLDPGVEEAYKSLGNGTCPIINVTGMDEMANVLIKFTKDRKLLKEKCKEAREWMVKYYTPEKIAKMYVNFYLKVIKENKRNNK